jgi:CRISPR-associated endonuclease/helicase Cas3
MPDEKTPDDSAALFARGIWTGDLLPSVALGDGVTAPEVKKLDLSPMLLGREGGQQSWAERMLRLRDEFGPLRLAYLEALIRAADIQASKAADARLKGGRS